MSNHSIQTEAVQGFVQEIFENQAGATAIEYGLILAMIVLVIVGVLGGTATETVKLWNDIATKAQAAQSGN